MVNLIVTVATVVLMIAYIFMESVYVVKAKKFYKEGNYKHVTGETFLQKSTLITVVKMVIGFIIFASSTITIVFYLGVLLTVVSLISWMIKVVLYSFSVYKPLIKETEEV